MIRVNSIRVAKSKSNSKVNKLIQTHTICNKLATNFKLPNPDKEHTKAYRHSVIIINQEMLIFCNS